MKIEYGPYNYQKKLQVLFWLSAHQQQQLSLKRAIWFSWSYKRWETTSRWNWTEKEHPVQPNQKKKSQVAYMQLQLKLEY